MTKLTKGAVALILALLGARAATSQQIRFDVKASSTDNAGGYWIKWDAGLQQLLCSRDVGEASLPAVRIVDARAKELALYPLKDFPGADHIDIWDAAEAPNGDVVIAAIIAYGPRKTAVPVKSLLLTYDKTGTLRAVWDVKPYHHHLVAADAAGNVFAFGDKDSSSDTYPLLVKYSRDGEVVKEFLSTSLFPTKDAVVTSEPSHGASQMFIRDEKLFLYISATREWFTFSLDGNLISRVPLAAALSDIRKQNDVIGSVPGTFSVDSNRDIVVQVRLYPRDSSKPQTTGLARFAPDGSFRGLTRLEDVKLHPARFLGLTMEDLPVYLEPTTPNSVTVDLTKRSEMP
jgi:hypothetical protein